MNGQQCARGTCTRVRDGGPYCRHHRELLRSTGMVGIYDTTAARDHLQSLYARGLSVDKVARQAGLAVSSVWRIGVGRSKRARAETLRKILALDIDTARARSVSSLGTRRRVQALVRIGWPYSELTRRTGLGATTLRKVIYRPRLTVGVAEKVAEVYRELAQRPGPSVRATTLAKRQGFLSPAAWGDEIDDPCARPNVSGYDESRVQAYMAGDRPDGLTRADRAEAAARLVNGGLTPLGAARALGTSAMRVREWLGVEAA